MEHEFTPSSLCAAIATLFRQNNYQVTGPAQLHGAEIDLVATPMADPFAASVYIEATIEHVNTDKYGKDLSKLALLGEKHPEARRLIVSSKGFSLPVIERARQTRIEPLTYRELFSRFEKFDPYIEAVTGEGALATDLQYLNSLYEEPVFNDALGREPVMEFLERWSLSEDRDKRWLIVTGEYGTGKTALTRVLQYRWTKLYRLDTSRPLPFRIELRDFTRQFDARSLLHHFLDTNNLGHIPIDFLFSLIRSGRILLLLDGYDEMAQYLTSRERRVCLEALAELSADGARGILTSRPNYFTEAEELQVLEVLYASLERSAHILRGMSRMIVERERQLDSLLEAHFLERYERGLEDLTPEQTLSLIDRHLAGDPNGRQVIRTILERVFRNLDVGQAVSLSGKPVIISYLLQIVEQLKQSPEDFEHIEFTEWGVFELILEQLMLRDFARSQRIIPERREHFLRQLALWLTQRDNSIINEEDFRSLVQRTFALEIRSLGAKGRVQETEALFEDLRSSATLTRGSDGVQQGWQFSHNSLREFLVTRELLDGVKRQSPVEMSVPVSDPMRIFVESMGPADLASSTASLTKLWPQRRQMRGVEQVLDLLWTAGLRLNGSEDDPASAFIRQVAGGLDLAGATLSRISVSSPDRAAHLRAVRLAESVLVDVDFTEAILTGADFHDAILESVKFSYADLSLCSFQGALLADVDLTGATVRGADFSGIDRCSSIIVRRDARSDGVVIDRLVGANAVNGYLRYLGSKTDPVDHFDVWVHHPRFPIVDKICRKLAEQGLRQVRGLVQRGAAQRDVEFARAFLDFLVAAGIAQRDGGHSDLVGATPSGREQLARLADHRILPEQIATFLEASPPSG